MGKRKGKPSKRTSGRPAITAPSEILDLVDRFRRNRDAYRDPAYKEAPLRREFVDPFFETLGWDVQNRQGHAEAYKDVVHEDAVKVGGATKAPDYGFRIGGQRKFFVEAKKPSVDLAAAVHASYQLRRYAWSAKLPLSILTDFEEFAVYDCRIRPKRTDKPSAARVLYVTFEDYATRWTDIADIFSKDAVLKGSFDRYAEKSARRGTATVDQAFLAEIETWRDRLARNLALRNPGLSVRDLNFAVQRTIDRIIFLRMGEDRGAEGYGGLLALVNGPEIYPRLVALFERADDKYNSGLFYFRREKGRPPPDELTPGLKIDDNVLKAIIRELYYPQSPYEFSVLGADILGQVYEQFLGKVIRLTPGHRAKVEEKPEVKKAGGVYYTPTYIVRYIVENTVGRLIDGKTPRQISRLRILDPACGSGSFLIGAYESLLNYHRDWYVEHDPKKHRKKIYQGAGGQWFLTIQEKKRILLNNIYGVDIDSQAVEVTKLSLLLKVLEGENQDSLQRQMRFLHERALPDLSWNVKCGNSLIGPDFFDGRQMDLFDDDAVHRINAFDWEAGFRQILGAKVPAKRRGFDAVIGNPPYGRTLDAHDLRYVRSRFGKDSGSFDNFELFLLKSACLLNSVGRLSMIIPASWLTGDKYSPSRSALLRSLSPLVAYVMPFDVFKDAYIDTAVVVLAKASASTYALVHSFPKRQRMTAVPQGMGTAVPIASILNDGLNRITVLLSEQCAPIVEKMQSGFARLGDWFDIQRGVQPYSRSKHSEDQIAARFLHAKTRRSRDYLPELQGNELSRYSIDSTRKSYLCYCDKIASLRAMRMFQGERLVLRRLLTRKFRLQASMTDELLITTDNVLNAVPRTSEANVPVALAVLNSRLISWFYRSVSMIAQKDDFPQVHISALAKIPLPKCEGVARSRMEELVKRILDLNKRLAKAQSVEEKTRLQRLIDRTDREIDRLVYDLYGLTKEEIAIVEGRR